jgi:light-regulated signal transduction histidine kinase (bacteriophytochrome)
MMMYSSRTKFRLDDTSDVGRNLFSTSQCVRGFDRIMIYLFLKHSATVGTARDVLTKG